MTTACYKCGDTSTMFDPPFTFCFTCRALLDSTEGKADAIDVAISRKRAFKNLARLEWTRWNPPT